jgi:hypothetical protein
MAEKIVPESVVSPTGPLPQVNVAISLPSGSFGEVVCPPGLTLRQKQRLLRAAKKRINAELHELCKMRSLVEGVRRWIDSDPA